MSVCSLKLNLSVLCFASLFWFVFSVTKPLYLQPAVGVCVFQVCVHPGRVNLPILHLQPLCILPFEVSVHRSFDVPVCSFLCRVCTSVTVHVCLFTRKTKPLFSLPQPPVVNAVCLGLCSPGLTKSLCSLCFQPPVVNAVCFGLRSPGLTKSLCSLCFQPPVVNAVCFGLRSPGLTKRLYSVRSHQLFHVAITLCILYQMDGVFLDFRSRGPLLARRPTPSFSSAFLPVILTITGTVP